VWWHKPVILVLGSTRQKDQEFQASLGYRERLLSYGGKKTKKERREGREEGRVGGYSVIFKPCKATDPLSGLCNFCI
jgi:hypothetical protein